MANFFFQLESNGYYEMGNSNITPYINVTVYKHDSADTSDKNITAGGYEALTPATPGFSAPIVPMEGFFIKLEINDDTNGNTLAYPLTYGNDK